MKTQVKLSREEILKMPVEEIKKDVYKQSYTAIKMYYEGRGNGPEAKLASVVLTTMSREKQAANNERLLDITVAKLNKEGIKLIGNGKQ